MKRRPVLRVELFVYILTYPLLLVLLVMGGLICHVTFSLVERISQEPTPTTHLSLAKLPPITTATVPYALTAIPQEVSAAAIIPESTPVNIPTVTATPASQVNIKTDASIPDPFPANPSDPPILQESIDLPAVTFNATITTSTPTPTVALDFGPYTQKSGPTRTPRPKTTPTSESYISEVVASLMQVIEEPTLPAKKFADTLPTLTPTNTNTAAPNPTATPTNTPVPTNTPTPTNTPPPTAAPPPTATSTPTLTPTPTTLPPPTPIPLPTDTPEPTFTPQPEYDFMLAEFYNSPTTNAFMVMYVAIVDPNQIPIGDVKVVGTRLDHNLTYESPLSTWYYEGYNAPGEVIKSGNLKFEPPGGIENTAWIIHLADPQGNRLSADVPFNTDQNDKQWYFVKFQRRY